MSPGPLFIFPVAVKYPVADSDDVGFAQRAALAVARFHVPGASARLLEQPHSLDRHASLDALRHVNEGQTRHRRRGQGLHLDTGLPDHPRSREDADRSAYELEVERHA